MEISITKHAVQRYRQRMFDFVSTEQAITRHLTEIWVRGCRVRNRPDESCSVLEYKYRGVSIVIRVGDRESTILTCLGDDNYRKWTKYQNRNRHIPGRLKYPPIALSS